MLNVVMLSVVAPIRYSLARLSRKDEAWVAMLVATNDLAYCDKVLKFYGFDRRPEKKLILI
jgi:hypothetical protein